MTKLQSDPLRRGLQRCLLAAGAALACAAALAPSPALAGDVVLGANTEGITGDTGASLDDFAQRTGAMPGIAMYYQDWNEGWSSAILNQRFAQPIRDRGAVPMVTWMPMLDTEDPVDQPAYTPARIAAGDFDAYIHRAAREVAADGQPVFIRLAHEMNGAWSPWGAGVNGNTPGDYRDMWRHVVGIFREERADNARWVWSPNTQGYGVAEFAPFYPGDAWVDYVALDGYNWGATKGSGWRSFSEVFLSSYRALRDMTHKPVMIGETGSAERGGDKAAWIKRIPETLAEDMPAVQALVWFDRDKETDWRVDSSASSRSAFQETAARSDLSRLVATLFETVAPEQPTDPDPTDPTDPGDYTEEPPLASIPVRIGGDKVREGDHGRRYLRLPVTLGERAERQVTIRYRIRNGSARNHRDFIGRPGKVRIRPGQRRAMVKVAVRGDRKAERKRKSFSVELRRGAGIELAKKRTSGVIVDDD